MQCRWIWYYFFARTSDPGASIRRVRGRTIQIREGISRRSRCEAYWCCEQLLWCCEGFFPCCEPSCLQHSTKDVAINVASLCVACCEQQGVQHQVLENTKHTSAIPLRPRLSRGGGAGRRREKLPKPSIRPWGVDMAHILQGIECPPSDGAFSARPGAIVGRIVGRKASDPVMMSITARPTLSSGFHGGSTTTAPYNTGPMLLTSSAGQVGSATPNIHPLPCFCNECWRWWWVRIPMYCVMLDFWWFVLVVLDPLATNFDVA
jgi:hypothetical protein